MGLSRGSGGGAGGDALQTIPTPQQLVIQKVGSITYFGRANPGTATSAAAWLIYIIDESQIGGYTAAHVKFANGSNEYENIWDNRLGYSYS